MGIKKMKERPLSETHLAYLKMFSPNTIGLNLPYSIGKTLEVKGLVEWIPDQLGSRMWAITDKGRAAVIKDRTERGNRHCRVVFAENVKFGGMP